MAVAINRTDAAAGGKRVQMLIDGGWVGSASGLEIAVENPIRADPGEGAGGLGIVGMRERAALLDGTLEAHRDSGTFRVSARLPYSGGGRR